MIWTAFFGLCTLILTAGNALAVEGLCPSERPVIQITHPGDETRIRCLPYDQATEPAPESRPPVVRTVVVTKAVPVPIVVRAYPHRVSRHRHHVPNIGDLFSAIFRPHRH